MAELPVCALLDIVVANRHKIRTSKHLAEGPVDLAIVRIGLRNGVKAPIQRRPPQRIEIRVGGGI